MGGKTSKSSHNPKRAPILSILGVGSSCVGKTSLIMRYDSLLNNKKRDIDITNVITTVSTEAKIITTTVKGDQNEDIEIKVKIWDTPGQERFQSVWKTALINTQGVFLIYDITGKESFNDLDQWINKIKEIQDISELPIIIMANKIDLKDQRVVTINEGKKIADDNGLPYFETSALTGEGVNEAFQKLIQTVYNKRK